MRIILTQLLYYQKKRDKKEIFGQRVGGPNESLSIKRKAPVRVRYALTHTRVCSRNSYRGGSRNR